MVKKNRIRTESTYIPFVSRIGLFCKGYIEGRFAYQAKENVPFYSKENAKYKKYLSKKTAAYKAKSRNYNLSLFEQFAVFNCGYYDARALVAVLIETIPEYDTVFSSSGLPTRFSEMLDIARRSEAGIDPLIIKLRRFGEYTKAIQPIRDSFEKSKIDLQNSYKEIVQDASKLSEFESELRYVVLRYLFYTNTRISWYWSGVVYRNRNKLPYVSSPQISQEESKAFFDALSQHRNEEIKEKTKQLEEILSFSLPIIK